MAGALMRAAPTLARRYGPGLMRTLGATAAGYALEGAAERVTAWIEGQEWKSGSRHRGLDLPAPVGTPVLSPTDAVVIGKQQTDTGGLELFLAGPRMARADSSDPNRWPRPSAWYARGDAESGRDEALVDDSGWRFGFAHLSGTNVDVGTIVRKGQQVATTGNSGKKPDGGAYGPHLHLSNFWVQDGLRDVHIFVDPAILIPGLPRSVPMDPIGPGAFVSVCILTRVSTREQAMAKCVMQQFPTGVGLNWAATVAGVR